MKEIIETTRLDFDKSSFLIDLVKHESGALYIEISQQISSAYKTQIIKINPSILTDLFSVLEKYQERIKKTKGNSKESLYELTQRKIIQRYFKGVSIKDLAMQFGTTVDVIKNTIIGKGFEVVSNEMPKSKRRIRRMRK